MGIIPAKDNALRLTIYERAIDLVTQLVQERLGGSTLQREFSRKGIVQTVEERWKETSNARRMS
jgi:hypothetical protein